MPQARLRDMDLWSLVILIVMCLVTFLIAYVAFYYALDYWAMYYCSGWNEGSGSVTSCSIQGIENYANNGYNMMLISAFTFGFPIFFPGLISLIIGTYWFTKKRVYKNDTLTSQVIIGLGLTLSALAFSVFATIFLLSSTSLVACFAQWGAPWAPHGCGM